MSEAALSELERELLDVLIDGGSRFGMPLPQITLETSPGREVIENALRRLCSRGLVRSEWSYSVLDEGEYEGHWWIITDAKQDFAKFKADGRRPYCAHWSGGLGARLL